MTKHWWQPPQLRTRKDATQHRQATWFELFFDLVFVVVIAELSAYLNREFSLAGFWGFVVFFLPTWWAWTGTTFYADRFDTDDVGHRLLISLQILGLAAFAVNAHYGLEERADGFILSYVAVRMVLVLMYLRAWQTVPDARSLTSWYAGGFTLAAAIWLTSVVVPESWRFGFWILGLAIDFGTPLTGKRYAAYAPLDVMHLPERVGLFTLIVLGESIRAVIVGVAEQEWQVTSVITAVFGFLLALSLWWLYFDNLDRAAIRHRRGLIWYYAHFPLVVGLTATGVGVEHMITSAQGAPLHAENVILLGSMVALCLASIAALHVASAANPDSRGQRRLALYRFVGMGAALLITSVGTYLTPVSFMGLIAAVCAAQVVADLRLASVASHIPGEAPAGKQRETAIAFEISDTPEND